jgi:hypothetical protein
MSDQLRIYLLNQTGRSLEFFCFLSPPGEMADAPGVFITTSSSLTAPSNAPNPSVFALDQRYVIGGETIHRPIFLGGASITPHGARAQISDQWSVEFNQDQIGGYMTRYGTHSPPGTITLKTSDFDAEKMEEQGFFPMASFGIKTDSGFMGAV